MAPSAPHVVMVPYAGFGQGDLANCVWFARALRAQGARVTLLATGPGARLARAHGEHVHEDAGLGAAEEADRRAPPLGRDRLEAFVLLRPRGRAPTPAAARELTGHTEALRRVLRELGADLVVAKYRWPALLAAESLALPRASIVHAPHHPAHSCPAAALDGLEAPEIFRDPYPTLALANAERARLGLGPLATLNACHAADLVLVMGPAQAALAADGVPTLLVGSAVANGVPPPARRPGRPQVYVYLGPARIGRPRGDGLRAGVGALLDALAADPGLDALLVDPDAPAWQGRVRLPPHVRVTPECLDAPREIARSALVVHSGGSFTGLAALDHGVPSLTLPYSGENRVRAAEVERRGAGLTLERSGAPPELFEVEGGDGAPWLVLGHRRFARGADEVRAALAAALAIVPEQVHAARAGLARDHVDAPEVARRLLALVRAGGTPE